MGLDGSGGYVLGSTYAYVYVDRRGRDGTAAGGIPSLSTYIMWPIDLKNKEKSAREKRCEEVVGHLLGFGEVSLV